MNKFEKLADEQTIEKTVSALKQNGIEAIVVDSGEEAKQKALELIAEGSEVMTMTSVTLDTIGLAEEINRAGGKYRPVRDKLYAMDKKTQALEMNRMGAAPEVVVGSVHAVTEDGQAVIASASGSQLAAYVYGASKVIWVAGGQKIVKNIEEGLKRLNDYVFELENERAKKAYGVGSGINKLLIVSREVNPGRITLILVKEKLGF